MNRKLRGYSTLVAVVLLLVFISMVIVGIHSFNLSSLQSGYQSNTSTQRLQESESCIEEILRRLKDDINYTGGTVPLNVSTSCTAQISGDDLQKTISATVNAQNIQKTITAIISITTDGSARNFRLTSWSEL